MKLKLLYSIGSIFLASCQFGFSYDKVGDTVTPSESPITPQDTEKLVFAETLKDVEEDTTQAGRWIDGQWRGIAKVEGQDSSQALGEFQVGQTHFVLGQRDILKPGQEPIQRGVWKNNDWIELKIPTNSAFVKMNYDFAVSDSGQIQVAGILRVNGAGKQNELVAGSWIDGEWKALAEVAGVKRPLDVGPVVFSSGSLWVYGSFLNNDDSNSIGFWGPQGWTLIATLPQGQKIELPALLSTQALPLVLGLRKNEKTGQIVLIEGAAPMRGVEAPADYNFLGPLFLNRNSANSQLLFAANFSKDGKVRGAYKELSGDWKFLEETSPEKQNRISKVKLFKDKFYFYGFRELADSKIEAGVWVDSVFKAYTLPENTENQGL